MVPVVAIVGVVMTLTVIDVTFGVVVVVHDSGGFNECGSYGNRRYDSNCSYYDVGCVCDGGAL